MIWSLPNIFKTAVSSACEMLFCLYRFVTNCIITWMPTLDVTTKIEKKIPRLSKVCESDIIRQ